LSTSKLNLHIGLLTVSRIFVATSFRMVYPFLAILASGLEVPIATISLAMAVSMVASAAVPFLAPVADQRGRKTGMLIGLGIFLAGTLASSLFPNIISFFVTILLCNLGNNLLISAMQAYMGDYVPYKKRGLYLAFSELSWALAFIVMVPLAGLVMAHANWNAPYIWLTGIGAVMTLVIWRVIPQDKPAESQPMTIFRDIKTVLRSTPAIFGMLMGAAFIIGNELINVVFGVWMQDSFGLQIAALGAASMIIGFSELSGEGLAAALADRVGKERLTAISFIFNGLWVISLPWLGQTQSGAMVWLFIFYLSFEVGIVSALPVMTEVVPKARATMMALFIAALSLGRAVGDLAAPALYKGGFIVNALVCLGLDLVAVFFLSRIKLPKPSEAE
jgi:predicted MFS family arabinose efflux permease